MCIYPIATRIIAKDFACSNDLLLSGVLPSSSSSFPGDFLLRISPSSLDPAFCKHILTSARDHVCVFSQAKQTKKTPTAPPAVPLQCWSACHFQWLFLLSVCNYPGMPFPALLRQPGFKAPQRAEPPGLQTLPSLQPASFSSIIFCQMGNLSNPNPNQNMEGRPSPSHPPLFESPARINKT